MSKGRTFLFLGDKLDGPRSVTVSVTFFSQTPHILCNQMQSENYSESCAKSSVSLFGKEVGVRSFSRPERFCKPPVGGSIPLASSIFIKYLRTLRLPSFPRFGFP